MLILRCRAFVHEIFFYLVWLPLFTITISRQVYDFLSLDGGVDQLLDAYARQTHKTECI